MSEESKLILRSAKTARIIENISEMFNVSLQEATDIYYNSETANLIEDGIADLHCRSDKYLAEEVWLEHQEKSAQE
jgi:aminoglycoside phosphotransferase family enzyme